MALLHAERNGVRLAFDGRNLLEPESVRNLGFTYHAIGRATTAS